MKVLGRDGARAKGRSIGYSGGGEVIISWPSWPNYHQHNYPHHTYHNNTTSHLHHITWTLPDFQLVRIFGWMQESVCTLAGGRTDVWARRWRYQIILVNQEGNFRSLSSLSTFTNKQQATVRCIFYLYTLYLYNNLPYFITSLKLESAKATLLVFACLYLAFMVLIGPYWSFPVLTDPYWSFMVHTGS